MPQYLDKKQIKRKNKIIKNIIFYVLFFVISALGVWRIFGSPLSVVSNPIWKLERFAGTGLHNLGYFFNSKSSLHKENTNLKEENLRMSLEMTDYLLIKSENEELKKMLNRIPDKNDFILANILTKPNRSLYDTVIVDIGEKEGVKEGYFVYANGENPLGRVSKVYPFTSVVSLFSNPKQKTEGFVNNLNISVELVGRGGGNFEMIIPTELSIEKDTMVYLPGNTPKVLAITEELISEPGDPFKKVILRSPVNIQNLKWLLIKKD